MLFLCLYCKLNIFHTVDKSYWESMQRDFSLGIELMAFFYISQLFLFSKHVICNNAGFCFNFFVNCTLCIWFLIWLVNQEFMILFKRQFCFVALSFKPGA